MAAGREPWVLELPKADAALDLPFELDKLQAQLLEAGERRRRVTFLLAGQDGKRRGRGRNVLLVLGRERARTPGSVRVL